MTVSWYVSLAGPGSGRRGRDEHHDRLPPGEARGLRLIRPGQDGPGPGLGGSQEAGGAPGQEESSPAPPDLL